MAFIEKFEHLKIQLEEIKSATNHFDDRNIIGKGGFGNVYKGPLSSYKEGSMVAFKRLDRRFGQGEAEFLKEIMMLSSYKHENLISLLGFCNEGDEMILVYEHASCGSLDRYLKDADLTWRQRIKICLEAAKALSYLHDPNGEHQRVLHCDIKSANILLDDNFIAKVADLGLSKIGPANQQYTFLITNAVGTPGYLDPLYLETYILTKESDVYSFGVVLYEVSCGKPCYEYSKSGQFQSLVPNWKQCYENKTLDMIIFHDLKQQMDLRSLETFSEIAYQCLQISREQRPTMALVAEKLEVALEFQEISERVKQPKDYEEIIKAAIPPLTYGCFFPMGSSLTEEKPFAKGCYDASHGKFNIHVRSQFLEPEITYTVNLVFQKSSRIIRANKPCYIPLRYRLKGEPKSLISYFGHLREDGWLEAELCEFTSDRRNIDLEILFEGSAGGWPSHLLVEGIEFLPVKKVEDEVFEISDSDTDWEQIIPNDYEEIIKWSRDIIQWTTKKELYFILCKGFLIDYGQKWFSLAENGKKCYMLPARAALDKEHWKWRPQPNTGYWSRPKMRFNEVAHSPTSIFRIVCDIQFRFLSPKTTYATYLVYKLQRDSPISDAPVEVYLDGWGVDKDFSYIFLVSPQIPVITRKVDENIYHSPKEPKLEGIPKLRNDGWMEVQVWEFRTGTTAKRMQMHLALRSSMYDPLKYLNIEGIEFKPI